MSVTGQESLGPSLSKNVPTRGLKGHRETTLQTPPSSPTMATPLSREDDPKPSTLETQAAPSKIVDSLDGAEATAEVEAPVTTQVEIELKVDTTEPNVEMPVDLSNTPPDRWIPASTGSLGTTGGVMDLKMSLGFDGGSDPLRPLDPLKKPEEPHELTTSLDFPSYNIPVDDALVDSPNAYCGGAPDIPYAGHAVPKITSLKRRNSKPLQPANPRVLQDEDVTLAHVYRFMKRRRVANGIPVMCTSTQLKYNPDGSIQTNELGLRSCCLCLAFSSFGYSSLDPTHLGCRCACHTAAAPVVGVSIGVPDAYAIPQSSTPVTYPTYVPLEVERDDAAVPQPAATPSSRRRAPYKCSRCRMTGHRVTNCPLLSQAAAATTSPQPGQPKRIYRCSNCKQTGHGVKKCTSPCSRCGHPDHRYKTCPLQVPQPQPAPVSTL
jgi:hypothetical protein